jgi:hypothetical protein
LCDQAGEEYVMKRADGFCCATADSGLLLAVEGLRKCGGLGSFDDEGGCGTSNALRKTVQWLREKRASATSKAAGKLILLKGTGFRACVRTKKKPQISPTETLSNGSCPLDPLFIKNTEPSTDR